MTPPHAARALLSLAVLLALRIVLAAPAPLAAQCLDLPECGGGSGPQVWIDPEEGSWSASAATMQVVVTLSWCAPGELIAVALEDQPVTASFVATPGTSCADPSTATGIITLTPGRHGLTARVRANGVTGMATAVYTYAQVGPPPAPDGVRVTPDAQPVTRGAAQRATERFAVENTGSAPAALSLGRACAGAGATACTLSHAALTVPGGGIVSVGVNYATGAAGTTGTVALSAWKTGDSAAVNDAGSRQVSVAAAPAAGRAGDPSHTTAVDRSACLMLPAGLGGVYECGDLRLAHALPATRVLNRSFAPTLLYSSQHAYPFPLVSAEVPAPPGAPTAVVVSLTVSGATRTREHAPWTGGPMRVGIGFDATGLPTGFHAYAFRVDARYADGSTTQLYPSSGAASGTMPIVNRSESRFGRGWWMAGVEELKSMGDGSLMWIGGDGSTLRYLPTGAAGRWAPEPYAGTDTIVQLAGSDTARYARVLPGGDTVFFDMHGRHRRTANRRGHRTLFEWSGDALVRVHLPRGRVFNPGTFYALEYGNPYGTLSRVVAPGPAASRIVTFQNADGRVTGIGGPDTTGVQLSYLDATPRITGARDRRRTWTSWRYDQGSRLKRAVSGAGTPDSAVFAYSAQESRPLVAAPPHLVYTAFDGPRPDTDVNDRTYFQVDRRGAPVEVKDALGHTTRVFREDPLWPGQVTRVRSPNGREVTSTFDEAGRLSSTTDWATSADGRHATTLYEWDARCGAVARVTLPGGEVTSRGYDALCLPAWTQAGADTLGRVRFAHHPLDDPRAPGLPAAVTTPAAGGNPAATESFAYDARGNLRRVTSPTGLHAYSDSDAIGRDTLLTSPIDAEQTLLARQRLAYDDADRVIEEVTTGPAMNGAPAKSVRVQTKYDGGGLPLHVRRRSEPDSTVIGWVTTGYRYDALGRKRAEIDPANLADSTWYDPAGNVIATLDRHSRRVSIRYDALGRPLRRTAGAQVDRFRYDAMGNLLAATNDNARVTRTYFDNGLLKTDSIRIRTATPSHADTLWTGYTAHVYGLAYEYDLNGRRTRVAYPANLVAGSRIAGLRDHARYGYDPATGALAWVEGLGAATRFDYAHDLLGRPDSVRMPGGVREKYLYDREGRLRHRRTTAPAGGSWWAGGTLRGDTLFHDARGKMTRARVTVINAGGISHGAVQTSTYDGIGNLVAAAHAFTSPFGFEAWNVDALGNQMGGTRAGDSYAQFRNVYEPHTSRLKWILPEGDTSEVADTTRYFHDWSGNVTGVSERGKTVRNTDTYGLRNGEPEFFQRIVETTSYYDQNGRLDYLVRNTNQHPAAGMRVRESYAYDALGRRVWRIAYNGWDVATQTQRDSLCLRPQPSSECRSFVERTVWDGDQVLLEIRAPVDPGPFGVSNPESDTGGGGYPYEFYGRVAYVHAGGIDQPLEIVRMDVESPFSAVPHANWRGTYDLLTFTGSRYAECGPQTGFELGTRPECFPFDLASVNAYGDLKPRNPDGTDPGPRSWSGSLITGSRDASGLLYRRNRYLDPKSGRFTQEDPIGLAGGLNAYGFANGDPVSYSDPYGLCPNPVARGYGSLQCAIQDVIGAAKRLPGAVLRGAWEAVQDPFVQQIALNAVPAARGATAGAHTMRLGRVAQALADAAQGARPRPGMAAAAEAAGKMTGATSGRRALHPTVQGWVDDGIAAGHEGYRGACAESHCISNLVEAGANTRGGTVTTRAVGRPGSARHGTPTPPCANCAYVIEQAGMTYVP